MPRYKLKPEFLEIGAGLMHSILPQMAEATSLIKELGYESSSPEGLGERVKEVFDRLGYDALSYTGGLVGSPLGFLPTLMDYYSSGVGTTVKRQGNQIYKPFRLQPGLIAQLWLRKYPNEEAREEWWQDLRDQGWSDKRIDAAKELVWQLPPVSDAIGFLAHEVYEPDMIEKYGLDDEFEGLDLTTLEKIGINKDLALLYWRDHWQHATWIQIVQMRRRELITDDDVKDWFRLVEIPPFWRDHLIALIWEIPTRVDVRRWRDMRTVNKTQLREIYGRQGYHGEDLDNYVKWTEVYIDFPDLMARYSKGWINLEDVRHQLVDVDGMPDDRFEELLQTKIKAVQEERISETTALTRSLIIKGAKEDKLTREETIELLMRKNYTLWEAEYIYDIEVGAAASPETPTEFRQLIESYRKATGQEFKEVPPELLAADKKRSDLRLRLAQARSKKAPEDEVAQLEANLEITEIELRGLKASYSL